MADASRREAVTLPTIGCFRDQGVRSARVTCTSVWCGHVIVVAFDDIALPDDTPFPAIQNRRPWACQRCRGREVSVMPDWRGLRESHPSSIV